MIYKKELEFNKGTLCDIVLQHDTATLNCNMKINTKMTKVMKISKRMESAMKIVVAGEIIEQVKGFCYLQNIRRHREIKRRIAMGNKPFTGGKNY